MRPDLAPQRDATGADADPTVLLLGLAAALDRFERAAGREAPPHERAPSRAPGSDPIALALLGLLSLRRDARRWTRHHAAAGAAAAPASPPDDAAGPPAPRRILR